MAIAIGKAAADRGILVKNHFTNHVIVSILDAIISDARGREIVCRVSSHLGKITNCGQNLKPIPQT